jgi:hypothetical protein
MRKLNLFLAPLVLSLGLVGCGDDSTSKDSAVTGDQSATHDMTGSDMAFASCCGMPGDPGNALGVGKFCKAATATADCNGSAAICSNLVKADVFFCTKICTPPGDMAGAPLDAAPDTQCGEGAACVTAASLGGSGCVPIACFYPAPKMGCTF